jgi:hypothetical protein
LTVAIRTDSHGHYVDNPPLEAIPTECKISVGRGSMQRWTLLIFPDLFGQAAKHEELCMIGWMVISFAAEPEWEIEQFLWRTRKTISQPYRYSGRGGMVPQIGWLPPLEVEYRK